MPELLTTTDERIVISWSELDAFHQCPWKWARAYQERWTTPVVSDTLQRGTDWHTLMELWYAELRHHRGEDVDTNLVLNQIHKLLDPMDEDRAALLAWMFEGYINHYGDDSKWRILEVEFKKELSLGIEVNDRPVWLKARIDLVVEDGMGRVWLVDHKSCKDLPKGKELDLDDQFGLYTWLLREIGVDVFGSIHNACRTTKLKNREMAPDERFKRTLLNRTESELKAIANDARSTVQMMAVCEIFGPGNEPRYTDPDRCRWRCPFTEPCLMHRKANHRDLAQMMEGFGFTQGWERH